MSDLAEAEKSINLRGNDKDVREVDIHLAEVLRLIDAFDFALTLIWENGYIYIYITNVGDSAERKIQLAAFRYGLICHCGCALATLHNSFQLVECAPANHSQRVEFLTSHKSNQIKTEPIAVARREFVEDVFTTVSENRLKRYLRRLTRESHSLLSFSINDC